MVVVVGRVVVVGDGATVTVTCFVLLPAALVAVRVNVVVSVTFTVLCSWPVTSPTP